MRAIVGAKSLFCVATPSRQSPKLMTWSLEVPCPRGLEGPGKSALPKCPNSRGFPSPFWRDSRVANPPTSYRSLSGPPGPKSPQSLKKVSRGRRPWGPQKSGKSLEKVPNRHFRDFFQTFQDPGAGGSGRLFSDFLGVSGPEGPRDSYSSSEGSQF